MEGEERWEAWYTKRKEGGGKRTENDELGKVVQRFKRDEEE
jgi:hypothetical protein